MLKKARTFGNVRAEFTLVKKLMRIWESFWNPEKQSLSEQTCFLMSNFLIKRTMWPTAWNLKTQKSLTSTSTFVYMQFWLLMSKEAEKKFFSTYFNVLNFFFPGICTLSRIHLKMRLVIINPLHVCLEKEEHAHLWAQRRRLLGFYFLTATFPPAFSYRKLL